MLFSGSFADDMKNNNTEYQQQQQLTPLQKRDSISDEVCSDDLKKKPRKEAGDSAKAPSRSGDDDSIEVGRRPRGRPPGSKNKPKPPVIITREADPPAAMRSHILEIGSGHDVVEAIAGFARRRGIGICVLAGSGAVSNVPLRQPMQTPATAVVLHGRFEILSISGAMLPPSMPALQSGVSVSLAGPQGQVVGGTVAGPLVAAGTVMVVAAGFENPSFHRFPANDGDDPSGVDISPGGDGCEADAPVHHPHRHHHHHHELNAPPAESCGMTIYSSHLPTDVIWTPTPRPPPPHY
ncbi:hypothetical protein J5N97_003082 [Dioscorea zingiberensis]|uniref:PPC domain-containing protein n=1 Tax=Dioscorea zingiberensis TaxID=325984 RepID=A0A9D5D3J3_9LILI|nr:hypothetical protein J5N97_003082 [Dioscorea zingiberensis]